MADWAQNLLWIGLTIFIVLLNGFFVAAEFAMVKVRRSQVEEMVRSGTAFATTLSWLMQRLEPALSACQLGITMASLALGWIGEPAIASLIEPLFVKIGIGSAAVVHVVAFIIAFTIITTAHLVIGEQVPKIYAIRRADRIALLCAWPLKIFYIATLPLLVALNRSTSMILAWLGIGGMSEHDSPHSEEEIRALLAQSHLHGELTKSEHHLLDAVFIFGETVARQIMLPRIDIDFLDVNDPIATSIDKARLNKHTRYPVCNGSMDEVLGVIHIKDLFRKPEGELLDLRQVMRKPSFVPETVSAGKLLGHFRASRQHLAFVIDEYGSVVGIVTLENVLERIVGAVQDEFDTETPDIKHEEKDSFIISGSAQIDAVNRATGLALSNESVDTLAGLLMERLGRVVHEGEIVQLDAATAEVIEVRNSLATSVRLRILNQKTAE